MANTWKDMTAKDMQEALADDEKYMVVGSSAKAPTAVVIDREFFVSLANQVGGDLVKIAKEMGLVK